MRDVDHGPNIDPITKQLLYLSVSQVTKFDHTQMGGCNRRWYFDYVRGQKEPPTAQQAVGVEAHAQIEHYLKTGEDTLAPVARAGMHLIPEPGPGLKVERGFSKAGGELVSHGIPFIGYVDLENHRGYYLDDDGELRDDPPYTVEVCDWKTTSSFKYTKTGPELVNTVQMTGYGQLILNEQPLTEHVRLSHVYFRTKGKPEATKSTTLVTADRIRERWRQVEGNVASMVEVAKIEDPSDVSPNFSSCNAYNKQCPYFRHCPRTAFDVLYDLYPGNKEPTNMGLMDALNKMVVDPDKAKRLEAHAAQLRLEETAARVPTVTPPVIAPQTTVSILDTDVDVLESGVIMVKGESARLYCGRAGIPYTGVSVQTTIRQLLAHGIQIQATGVLPPDAPKSNPALASEPLPVADVPPLGAEATYDKPRRGRPPGSKTKAPEPVVEAPASLPETTAVADLNAAPVATWKVTYQAPAEGIELYVDCPDLVLPEGTPVSLEAYVHSLADKLASASNVADIRCAPKDSPLAYGGWRGALTAAIKASPPGPGVYALAFVTGDEILEVAVKALKPLCRRFVRGGR